MSYFLSGRLIYTELGSVARIPDLLHETERNCAEMGRVPASPLGSTNGTTHLS